MSSGQMHCRPATFLLASGTFSALIRLLPKVTFNGLPIERRMAMWHPRQVNANGWVDGPHIVIEDL
jgi:hypothetical protein